MLGIRNISLWQVLIVVTGLLVLGAQDGRGQEVGERVTVVGVVEANDVDDDGTVLSVYIVDEELGDVGVAETGSGFELLDYVGSVVEAIGILEESGDEFEFLLHVEEYQILE